MVLSFTTMVTGCSFARLEALNADQSKTLPTADYVIIVGQQKNKPNMIVVVVYNQSNDGGQSMARVEHWFPNDSLQEKAKNRAVFAVW